MPFRVRVRNALIDQQIRTIERPFWNHPWAELTPVPLVGQAGKDESIEDDLPRFKPGVIGEVIHTKRELAIWPDEPVVISGLVWDYSFNGYAAGQKRSLNKDRGSGSPASGFVPMPGLLSKPDHTGLASKALSRLGENLSLLNSIWETQDIPALFRPSSIMGRVKRALPVIRDRRYREAFAQFGLYAKRGGPFWFRNWKSFARRTVPDVQLEIAFGWLPTISDATSLGPGLRRAWKRRTSTKPIVVSKVVKDSEYYIAALDTKWDVRYVTERSARACLAVYPTPPGAYYTRFFEQLDNFGRRVSRGGNAAGILWEAIPYSFVVDWLLSIDNVIDNDFLSRYSGMAHCAWTSQKSETKRLVKLTVPLDVSPTTGYDKYTEFELGGDVSSTYHRGRADLPTPFQEAHSRLSLYKGFLGVLLALGSTSGRKIAKRT